jgi:hypothetical protein
VWASPRQLPGPEEGRVHRGSEGPDGTAGRRAGDDHGACCGARGCSFTEEALWGSRRGRWILGAIREG